MRARSLSVLLGLMALVSSPKAAHADQRPGHERTDFTAYTLRRNELSLGIWSEEYGLLDSVTIGTYLPTWFVFPFLGAPIVTGYVKVRDWFFGPVAFSLRGTLVYLDASVLSSTLTENASTTASLFVVPLEASVSVRAHPRLTQSLQITTTYVSAGAHVPGDTTIDTALGGATATSSVSLSTLTELRLTRVVALTLRETLLLGSGDVVAEGHYETSGLRVDAQLGAVRHYRRLVGNVIPGIAFSWKNVNLQLGVGYGANWLPIVVLPTSTRTLVPDASFYVRF